MEQRITVLTIGANDLVAMRNFYSQILGWKTVAENKDIIFFQLNGLFLSLCDKKMLTDFIGINTMNNGYGVVTIGYNVATIEEVKSLYQLLKTKVRILKEPTAPPFGGLFFYFADIEGNILEVACNPFITLDKDNNPIGHKPIDHL